MVMAIVLGGGGSRGAYQAGVLAELLEGGVRPRFVIGTSIGAVNALGTTRLTGAALAAWWARPLPAALPHRLLARELAALAALPVVRPWPALAVACDLRARHPHVADVTVRPDFIQASAALPGLMPPVRWQGRWYADGGLVDDLPVDLAYALGATQVLAIHASGLGPVPARAATLRLDAPRLAGLADFSLGHRRRLLAQGRKDGAQTLDIWRQKTHNSPNTVNERG
ncbi:patatin-like phospholipase family protein [Lacticaseibacillus kribbianus]|uniref:patatin-like phospholipase family protein n=1 Tax=Lacticaseibacillus kribbianus TaxID=2926292 RepID=UPI001CD448F4|nr:patatin-like phospholipase family protein [Lacticaseibacillus kribbianus]